MARRPGAQRKTREPIVPLPLSAIPRATYRLQLHRDFETRVQEIEAPKFAAQEDAIYLNDKLFQRVSAVYKNREKLKLDRKPALLLGMNAIRAFKKVSIDFANRKFRVVLPEESSLMFELAQARLR